MKCVAYIATSIDGYIATPGGGLEWLDQIPMPEGTDFGWEQFISSVDVLVMGRNTFDVVMGFDEWPYELPLIVMSSTMTEVPERARSTEISSFAPRELIEELARRGFSCAYVDGGALITSFLAAGLLDELIVTQVPVVLGSGIPLFGELPEPVWLDLLNVEMFGSGATELSAGDAVLQYHYRRPSAS